jgi:hypothetical protein
MNWMKKLLGIADRNESIHVREEEIENQPLTVQPPRSIETVKILIKDIGAKVQDYRDRNGREPKVIVMSEENWILLRPYFWPRTPVRTEPRFDGFAVL